MQVVVLVLQAWLQAPQSLLLVLRFTSQPSAAFPLQSAKPVLQEATAQAPLEQAAVPFTIEHTCPQEPQSFGFVWMFTSQPSAAFPSQSAKPELQDPIAQAALTQAGVPFGTEQACPQEPQLLGFVWVFTSQPSEGSPLQSAKPALHEATAQLPLEQSGVPFGIEHRCPQAPQSLGFVWRFTSQPLAAFPSQLAKPLLHEAIWQVPLVQDGVPFWTEQTCAQEPQLFGSAWMFMLHPLAY